MTFNLAQGLLQCLLRDLLQLRAPDPKGPTCRGHQGLLGALGPTPQKPAPPPPPLQAQSVRFRPDRPRQPELLRKLNSQPVRPAPEFKPYQLKPKRCTNVEPFLQPPIAEPPTELPPDPKKLKHMKKKLDELNSKMRHSRKHDGLIHKRNSLRKVIGGFKQGNAKQPAIEPEQGFVELERAFCLTYRSYKVNGRPRMDVDTFFNRIRGDLINLITRELTGLNSVRVQTTTWIRFIKDDDRVELAFNSRTTNVHQGSDLDQIVDEMITHMKTQIENPALLNSRFRFDEVLFLDINFHWLNLTRGSSYLPLLDWLARKKAIINPQNDDEECFKWAVIAALRWTDIKFNPERVSNLRKFANNYDRSGLKSPVSIKDINIFEMNNDISVNVLSVEDKDVYICRKG